MILYTLLILFFFSIENYGSLADDVDGDKPERIIIINAPQEQQFSNNKIRSVKLLFCISIVNSK